MIEWPKAHGRFWFYPGGHFHPEMCAPDNGTKCTASAFEEAVLIMEKSDDVIERHVW